MFGTSSASAAATSEIAATPSAARAVDHSAAASPSIGDSIAPEYSALELVYTFAGSMPMQLAELNSAVEFLLFTTSPMRVSDTNIESFSGAT
ncbi:MAG: hypothetical protein ABI664_21350 [bacterium]